MSSEHTSTVTIAAAAAGVIAAGGAGCPMGLD